MTAEASSDDSGPTSRPFGEDDSERFIDSATRRGLISRYGDQWVTAMPTIIERLTSDNGWQLRARLTGGRTACVLLVEIGTELVVVKVTPDIDRSAREEAALTVLAANGVGPKVLDHWLDAGGQIGSAVMVLEALGDGTSLRDEPSRNVPARALADLLRSVEACGHCPLAVPLQTLESNIAWRLQDPHGGGMRGAPPPTPEELASAKDLLRELTSSPDDGRWIHGTLHPGNLIRVGDAILTIDPRPFRGDSAYDVAELAIKWGSERQSCNHNFDDGIALWRELKSFMHIDEERVVAWMRIILAAGA